MQLFSSWTGSDFLVFYTMLLGMSTLAAWWIPAHLREPGRRSESRDAEDLALLAGGRQRHADSVIADLFARGGLAALADGKLRVAEPGLPASAAGRALLTARAPIGRREAETLLAAHAVRIGARPRREGGRWTPPAGDAGAPTGATRPVPRTNVPPRGNSNAGAAPPPRSDAPPRAAPAPRAAPQRSPAPSYPEPTRRDDSGREN